MCRPEWRTGRSHPDRASRAIRVAPGSGGAAAARKAPRRPVKRLPLRAVKTAERAIR